jgi:hypothetical protein
LSYSNNYFMTVMGSFHISQMNITTMSRHNKNVMHVWPTKEGIRRTENHVDHTKF